MIRTFSMRSVCFFLALVVLASLSACDTNESTFADGTFPESFQRVWTIDSGSSEQYYIFSEDDVTLREIDGAGEARCQNVLVTELLGRDGDRFRLLNSRGQVAVARITRAPDGDLLFNEGDGPNERLTPADNPPAFDTLPTCDAE